MNEREAKVAMGVAEVIVRHDALRERVTVLERALEGIRELAGEADPDVFEIEARATRALDA